MIKKISVTGIAITLLVVSMFSFSSSAASYVISADNSQIEEHGNSFSTSVALSRSELISFRDDLEYAERFANGYYSVTYGAAMVLVTNPITRLGFSISSGGASGLISFLLIDKDLSSSYISSKLESSTASTFVVTINYDLKRRGYDRWYEAESLSVVPHWSRPR